MKKHSDSPQAQKPYNPEALNTSPKTRVRYVGFERVDGGRRLSFCVKLPGHDSVDITFKISEAPLKLASGISIQDAAPMAYEKLVELLEAGDTLDSMELRLTETDIAHYIARHLTSQKRTSILHKSAHQ